MKSIEIQSNVKKALGYKNFSALIMQLLINRTRDGIKTWNKREEELKKTQRLYENRHEFSQWISKKLENCIKEACAAGFSEYLEEGVPPYDLFSHSLNDLFRNRSIYESNQSFHGFYIDGMCGKSLDFLKDINGFWCAEYSFNDIATDCDLDIETIKKELLWLVDNKFIIRKKNPIFNTYPWWYQVVNQEWI